MKKLLFTGAILYLSTFSLITAARAQVASGKIVYERKINLHRGITDEQTKAMVPEFRTGNYQLFFSDSISVYKPAPQDEMPDPFNSNNGGIIIRLGPSDNAVLYKNFGSHTLVMQAELEEKKYLVSDSLNQDPWKLGEETKTILNHVCKKATRKDQQNRNVAAWYATDIPVPSGPDRFGSLPGLILLLDINEGEIVFTAQEISPRVDKKELKAPSDGKPITAADFRKKTEALFGPPGPGGRTIHTVTN
jgi:GLPGLI family protein